MAGRNLDDIAEMIIVQGGTYQGGFTLTDEFGAPITSAWTGRLEVRDTTDGSLITAFAASGEPGTLTINNFGQVLLNLPSTVTAGLTPTSDSLGLNSFHYEGDLEVWQPATLAARYKPEARFRVYVRPEVTTG